MPLKKTMCAHGHKGQSSCQWRSILIPYAEVDPTDYSSQGCTIHLKLVDSSVYRLVTSGFNHMQVSIQSKNSMEVSLHEAKFSGIEIMILFFFFQCLSSQLTLWGLHWQQTKSHKALALCCVNFVSIFVCIASHITFTTFNMLIT